MIVALKFLTVSGVGPFSGKYWPQPRSGKAIVVEGELEPCVNGLHATTLANAPLWLDEQCWIAGLFGKVGIGPEKIAASHGRLLERVDHWDHVSARLLAADYAEHVTDPSDERSMRAIDVARRFARDQAPASELVDARDWMLRVTGNPAARETVLRHPSYALFTTAWSARWYAGRMAGRDVNDPAWKSAEEAELRWQSERLATYLGDEVVSKLWKEEA